MDVYVAYAATDERAETQLQPLWKVCFEGKIPWKEHVDEGVFSLIVRGRNGTISQGSLTKKYKEQLFEVLFINFEKA